MLRVVLDTNVLVSALLKPDSTPELVVLLILENLVLVYVSEAIFTEYEEVLNRKKFRRLSREKVKAFLDRLKARARWVEPRIHLDIIQADPQDNRFLECAEEARADFFHHRKYEAFPVREVPRDANRNPG